MDKHLIIYAALWLTTIIMAWLPYVSKIIKISYPIMLLVIGVLLYYSGVPISWPDPLWPNSWVMYISEAIVIISLMWAGLKIWKNYTLSDWKVILRLILISMPIFLVGSFLFWYMFLWLGLPAAILLSAVLSPTDPVLASEVQIQKLTNKNAITSRFALTWEAWINDWLAFPFTILALAVFTAGEFNSEVGMQWFLDSFLLKVFLWFLLWYLFWKFLGWLIDKVPDIKWIWAPAWFIALSITFFVYATTELLHGYWFLAVFIAAVVIRHREEVEWNIKHKMHNFTEEIEKILLVFWIILFWASILNWIFDSLTWKDFIFALVIIFILRPLGWMIALYWVKEKISEKLVISFFGIRWIWSIFYLSWAFVQNPNFPWQEKLYAIVSLVILISIITHWLTAPYFIKKVETDIAV